MRIGLGPDDEYIRNGCIRDPGFRAIESVAARDGLGARAHAARVGPGVRFREAESADPLATREPGKVALAKGVVAIGEDRVHDERRLYRKHRAIAGVDAFEFASDQAIADVGGPKTAVFLRDGQSEQAHLSHFGENLAVHLLLGEGLEDARLQPLGGKCRRRVANLTLVCRQLGLEPERVCPEEVGGGHRVHHIALRQVPDR